MTCPPPGTAVDAEGLAVPGLVLPGHKVATRATGLGDAAWWRSRELEGAL